MNLKELLKNKSVLNGFEQLRQTLNKRGFDIEFFSKGDKVGFNIVEKKEI